MRTVTLARCVSALLVTATAATSSAQLTPMRPQPALQPGQVVLPLVITAPITTAPVFAGVRTSVSVKVERAKNGTTLTVKPVAPTPGCGFVTRQPVVAVTATVSGTTTVVVPGMFVDVSHAAATTCSFSAEVTATKLDGSTTTTLVSSSSVALTPLTTYVLTNTTDWMAKFAFSNVSASGDCTGSSNGPNGIFRVGLLASENGQSNVDLTFKIRSGPTGTRCQWTSEPMLLPEGTRLSFVELAQSASGPCRATPSVMPPGVGGFFSTTNPVVASASVVGPNPLGAGYAVFGIAPLTLSLDCSATASNDRFVTLVIRSLTFVGPPNLTGFP